MLDAETYTACILCADNDQFVDRWAWGRINIPNWKEEEEMKCGARTQIVWSAHANCVESFKTLVAKTRYLCAAHTLLRCNNARQLDVAA